jgi:hypothetical protein
MELAIRDHQIFQMKAELENRKKILCSKRKQLQRNSTENNVLNQILEDYNNYNNHIFSQKQQQIDYLNMLNDYITSITSNLIQTDHAMKESKYEQREIIKEINKLRVELNELIDE